MRRFIREGYVRYAFTRFGVPYVVSIQCLDSAPRARRLACREAYPIAERFLKALRIAGGQPAQPRHDISSEIAERPTAASPDFTYYPGGDIIARSSVRRRGGRADFAAYSQIRFPLEKAPAAIRSQSFGRKNSERAAASIRGGTIFAKPAASRSGNAPPASASGPGHPPRALPAEQQQRKQLPSEEAGRRGRARRHPDPLTEAAGGNAADQHTQRAHPLSLHAHEPVSHGCGRHSQRAPGRRGRKDRRGLQLSRFPERHSYHLHFDMQVFTRDGWIWVNPYTTLIASYERLIRGRGREIGTDPPAVAAVAHGLPENVLRHGARQGEGREN
jgi:hypothetical protein